MSLSQVCPKAIRINDHYSNVDPYYLWQKSTECFGKKMLARRKCKIRKTGGNAATGSSFAFFSRLRTHAHRRAFITVHRLIESTDIDCSMYWGDYLPLRLLSEPRSFVRFAFTALLAYILSGTLSASCIIFYGMLRIQRLYSACFAMLLRIVSIDRLICATSRHLAGIQQWFHAGPVIKQEVSSSSSRSIISTSCAKLLPLLLCNWFVRGMRWVPFSLKTLLLGKELSTGLEARLNSY